MDIQQFFRQGMDREIPQLLENKFKSPIVVGLGESGSKKHGRISLGLPKWEFPRDKIPLGNDTVHEIHAYHFLEHLSGENVILMLREIERVLAPGGIVNICVPYYSTSMQAQDLTHKSQWCETSFSTLFENKYYDPAGKWQLRVHALFIMGIVERNMALFAQLTKD
jgi:hypothetical protein